MSENACPWMCIEFKYYLKILVSVVVIWACVEQEKRRDESTHNYNLYIG